jgi:hypothetical protein
LKHHPLINSKKIALRITIALGMAKMAEGASIKLNKAEVVEILQFNSAPVDPEGIFEVVAYYIISKRLGASVNKKKLIIANKEEIAETITEAFVIGLKELPNLQYLL